MDIQWKTGTPDKRGFYITTRERKNGDRYVSVNDYESSSLNKFPLPEMIKEGWQVNIPDTSKIIAWCHVDDIKPYKI